MHFKYRRQTVCRSQQRECPLSEEVDPSVSRRTWWLFVFHRGLRGPQTSCLVSTRVWPGGRVQSWPLKIPCASPIFCSAPYWPSHTSSLREVLPLIWEDDVRLERQGKVTHPQQLSLNKQRDDSLKLNMSAGYWKNRPFSSQRDAFKFHNDLFAHKDFSAVKNEKKPNDWLCCGLESCSYQKNEL